MVNIVNIIPGKDPHVSIVIVSVWDACWYCSAFDIKLQRKHAAHDKVSLKNQPTVKSPIGLWTANLNSALWPAPSWFSWKTEVTTFGGGGVWVCPLHVHPHLPDIVSTPQCKPCFIICFTLNRTVIYKNAEIATENINFGNMLNDVINQVSSKVILS